MDQPILPCTPPFSSLPPVAPPTPYFDQPSLNETTLCNALPSSNDPFQSKQIIASFKAALTNNDQDHALKIIDDVARRIFDLNNLIEELNKNTTYMKIYHNPNFYIFLYIDGQ